MRWYSGTTTEMRLKRLYEDTSAGEQGGLMGAGGDVDELRSACNSDM
jgi:hypothetical protein